jgi:hypothetical protein
VPGRSHCTQHKHTHTHTHTQNANAQTHTTDTVAHKYTYACTHTHTHIPRPAPHAHRPNPSIQAEGTWLEVNHGIQLRHNCCFLIGALQVLYYNPSTGGWVRSISPWLAQHVDVQSSKLERVRALSSTLAQMGRGDTSWPRLLYRMLMLTGLVHHVAEFNDVQETYSKLTEWITEGNHEVVLIDAEMSSLLGQPVFGWIEERTSLACPCGNISEKDPVLYEIMTVRIPEVIRASDRTSMSLDELLDSTQEDEKVQWDGCPCPLGSALKATTILPRGQLIIDITRQYYDTEAKVGVPSSINIEFDPDHVVWGENIYVVQTLVIWIPAHYYVVQRISNQSEFIEHNNDTDPVQVSAANYGKHVKMLVLTLKAAAQLPPRPSHLQPVHDSISRAERALRSWQRLVLGVRHVHRNDHSRWSSDITRAIGLINDQGKIEPDSPLWAVVVKNSSAANHSQILASLMRLRSPTKLATGEWLFDSKLFLNDVLFTDYTRLLNVRTVAAPGVQCHCVDSGYFSFLYDVKTGKYDYNRVRNWGRRDPATARPNISDLQLMLVPINWVDEQHFTLAALKFDCDPPSIEYYDPLHGLKPVIDGNPDCLPNPEASDPRPGQDRWLPRRGRVQSSPDCRDHLEAGIAYSVGVRCMSLCEPSLSSPSLSLLSFFTCRST